MRRQPSLGWGAALGALTGLAVVAISFLAEQWAALPFFPFTLFDWLARVLPGGVITLGIDTMVRLIVASGTGPIDVVAKTLEQTLGVVLWIVGSALVGLVLAAWLQRRPATGGRAGVVAGLIVAVIELLALAGLGSLGAASAWTFLWLAVLVVGWGAILGGILAHLAAAPSVSAGSVVTGSGPRMGRREFLLRAGGGSALLAALAAGLGWLVAADKAQTGAGQPLGELNAAAAPPATATPAAAAAGAATPEAAVPIPPPPAPAPTAPPTPPGRLAPAPGTRPEVTSNADFYRIDIDLAPPTIDGSSWQMQVSGLFDRPRPLTLKDLLAMPSATQPITQSCISNPIGGDLISSAYYTGVPLRNVLQELGLQPRAQELALRAADGFYESVEMQDMMDPRVLLVYGMNGTSLPIEHGYPLRIYIPNRYGMKQPKWITSMEAIDHKGAGYWVDRGWSAEARPQVISIIDSVAKNDIASGKVPIGGIAWAGDRGIRSVEVQVDEGAWAAAALRTPPLGPLTWVQWRYDWPVVTGQHTFRVRATDGKGTLQNGSPSDTYPNGATGYHQVAETF